MFIQSIRNILFILWKWCLWYQNYGHWNHWSVLLLFKTCHKPTICNISWGGTGKVNMDLMREAGRNAKCYVTSNPLLNHSFHVILFISSISLVMRLKRMYSLRFVYLTFKIILHTFNCVYMFLVIFFSFKIVGEQNIITISKR